MTYDGLNKDFNIVSILFIENDTIQYFPFCMPNKKSIQQIGYHSLNNCLNNEEYKPNTLSEVFGLYLGD